MMGPSLDGLEVRGNDRLLMGCNLAALSLALIGLWVLVAILTDTDTTNAISIGGATGILIGAAGGYAQSGSRRHGWTAHVRKTFQTIARSIVWLTIVIAPLSFLADIVLMLTHCLGRACSRNDQYMVWTGIVFTIIASVLTIASWIYVLPYRRATQG
ncbi:MAG: hypothetical protein ACRYG8_06605 [Janthinobacterium lividum]